MEQNGTFLENFKYNHWILHKKLVCDEIYNFFINLLIIIIIMSLNIGPKLIDPHTPEYPFPLAVMVTYVRATGKAGPG